MNSQIIQYKLKPVRPKRDFWHHRIQARLAKELSGQTEVSCGAGHIDILTATEVIEIKRVGEWKEAIGQVLAYYSHLPPGRFPRIHLFGTVYASKEALIRRTCRQLGIRITFEGN